MRPVGEVQWCLAMLRTTARKPGLSSAAIAWDGYATVDGQRTDAVNAAASVVGDPLGAIMAQRYDPSGGGPPRLVGRPALTARPRSLLLPDPPD